MSKKTTEELLESLGRIDSKSDLDVYLDNLKSTPPKKKSFF